MDLRYGDKFGRGLIESLLAFLFALAVRGENEEPDGECDEPARGKYEQDPGLEVWAEQVDAEKCSGSQDFANGSQAAERKPKSETRSEAVERGLPNGLL